MSFAFDDPALEWDATWTALDQEHPNLVASWSKDSGRQFELDRTDGARATVQLLDPDGILDPTNAGGPYFGKIEPLVQVALCRKNPVVGETDGPWFQRFRGWISDITYDFDPSQQINRLTVELVDIFEILAAIQMLPGQFGDTPDVGAEGQIQFDEANMDARIVQALGNAGIPSDFYAVFTGNVALAKTVYSPGESPMTVIQEAADAEFPGVSNVYTDRFGRLAVHGRLAKFDPATIAAVAGDEAWDWHNWNAGDGAAVTAAPSTTAQIRRFAFNRGLASIRNSALAYPMGALDEDIAGQISQDAPSIAQYGIRSWAAPNLLTLEGLLDGSTALEETAKFGEYITDNYADPKNRVTDIAFRSMRPGQLGHVINWRLLSMIDIADQINITIDSPGGGGFTAEEFFVEGIHESSEPLNAEHDNDTVALDLSPKSLFTSNPFPVS